MSADSWCVPCSLQSAGNSNCWQLWQNFLWAKGNWMKLRYLSMHCARDRGGWHFWLWISRAASLASDNWKTEQTFVYLFVCLFVYWSRVSSYIPWLPWSLLCRPGWPWTCDLPASLVLECQLCSSFRAWLQVSFICRFSFFSLCNLYWRNWSLLLVFPYC